MTKRAVNKAHRSQDVSIGEWTKRPPTPSTELYKGTLTTREPGGKYNKLHLVFPSSSDHLDWQRPLTLTKALAAAGGVFIAGTRYFWSPAEASSTQVSISSGKNTSLDWSASVLWCTATAVDPLLPPPQLQVQGGSLLADPAGCASQAGRSRDTERYSEHTNVTDEMKPVRVYLQWRTEGNV